MGFPDRAFSTLRVAGLITGAAVVVTAAAGYWFFISQQRQYIVGRDFRVLSNLATQLDNTVQAEARVIKNLQHDVAMRSSPPSEKALTARWLKLRGRPYQGNDIQFQVQTVAADYAGTAEGYRFRTDVELVLDVPVQPRHAGASIVVAALRLQPGFQSMFTSKVGQGAFDAILLGTIGGKVLLSAGETAQQIKSSGLSVLSAKTPDGKPTAFSELAKSITMTEVSLAGIDYTLFLVPCCLSADKEDQPLVLAGLVRAETLRSGSWAISTTLVKLSVLALLVAMVGWPFMKLLLLGERQQLRVTDFFQLGASSVAGLAIVTIVLFDAVAYRQLQRDIDGQLKGLAQALDSHATAEIRDAYVQLECLEQRIAFLDAGKVVDGKVSAALNEETLTCPPVPTRSAAVRPLPAEDARLNSGPPLTWAYPFFETVTFIDKEGMQQLKLGTAGSASNRISVEERDYFRTVVRGRGWNASRFCQKAKCAFESILSWTTGEPVAVLAKSSSLKWEVGDQPELLPVAAISIPMRSLIGPLLPPGFSFAVIDHTGKVLFHSDRQRNASENLFVETDNNRRLRAQIVAHSAEPLNISYWGSEYRAYLKPMALPDMYVVAMAQKERAWAINREWLVVTLIFVAIYLALWLIAALATLASDASWVWPDPARRHAYVGVSALCVALLVLALIAAWHNDRKLLLSLGVGLPLAAWVGSYLSLRHRSHRADDRRREPVLAYSIAAMLVLFVCGVVPGALLFLASYQLHARSYIKNSQLIVARQLNARFDRLNETYLGTDGGHLNAAAPAATKVGLFDDQDIYLDFLYGTSIARLPSDLWDDQADSRRAGASVLPVDVHDDMVLSLLEDYLPSYSEASVEWRELLHDRADDGSWESREGRKGIGDDEIVFASNTGGLPIELTSWVPAITHGPPTALRIADSPHSDDLQQVASESQPRQALDASPAALEASGRNRWALLLAAGIGLLAIAGGVVQIFNRHIYLVGITEPLWARGQLAANAGENVLVLCDRTAKARQLAGITPLQLGAIARHDDRAGAWRRALLALDERSDNSAVLIDDFDDGLDDAQGMDHKLTLLEELVSDQSRTVILLSQVSLRGLTDSLRHAARVIAAGHQGSGGPGQPAAAPAAGETILERWRRVLKAFVVVERREQDAAGFAEPASASSVAEALQAPPMPPLVEASSARQSWSDRFGQLRTGPVVAFLVAEGESHPYVSRVCEELRSSNVVKTGRLTRRQAFDEVGERTFHFYRSLWASCSEDEKVVLGHIAQHGLANASLRRVVRRLLGRRLLCKDPSLRPMNETFRRFILTGECSQQVSALETENGPSAWDRLRAPLGVAVVGVAVFLFATQKELYNAILGITTAAAVSVPTLIRTVSMLVGRSEEPPGAKA